MDWIKKTYDSILGLPKKIVDLISKTLKELFIPKRDISSYFKQSNQDIKSKAGYNQLFGVLSGIYSLEAAPVQDYYIENLNILGVNIGRIKIFDAEYIVQGVSYLRPYIRGFLVILTVFYFVDNFAKMFNIDLGFRGERHHKIGRF